MPDLEERSALGSAIFSPDRRHRYLLTRQLAGANGVCCFVLLNPSRANASSNDPTLARCVGFADRWNCRALQVVNLFSLVSSDPRALTHEAAPIGPRNDEYMLGAAKAADRVVAGWGRKGTLGSRSTDVRDMLRSARIDLHAFGITKNGEPRHPLYVPYSSALRRLA